MSATESKPSVCCVVLTMPYEVDVTLQLLDSLLYPSREQLSVLVLMNGGRSESLRAAVRRLDQVTLYESDENLGVAGGRAFLAAQQPAREADIIALLDNDLLLTVDYLEAVCAFLWRNPLAGVAGASVLKYDYVSPVLHAKDMVREGPLGLFQPRPSNADLASYVEQRHTEEMFFHLGVDPDWMNAYFPRLTPRAEYARRKGEVREQDVFFARNRSVHRLFENVGPDRIEVSNIAGCTQVFRRSLYDEVGGIREEYAPYGFEDVDFCLRALKQGYRNYTLTGVFSLHGTDDRHQKRITLSGLWPSKRNGARAYALLAHHHCPWSRRPFLLLNALIRMGMDLAAIAWRLFDETADVVIRLAASLTGLVEAQFRLLRGAPVSRSVPERVRGDSGPSS